MDHSLKLLIYMYMHLGSWVVVYNVPLVPHGICYIEQFQAHIWYASDYVRLLTQLVYKLKGPQ